MTTTSDTAHAVRDELGQDAAHLRDTLGDRARQEATSRKDDAASIAGSASQAMGAAVDHLRQNPDSPEWMAQGLQKVAQQIDRLGGGLEGSSIDDLTNQISRFARENPGTFLAVSAAAGFTAARLLRVGADHNRHERDSDQQQQQVANTTTSGWPADENVKPVAGSDGFVPAYGAEGGTVL